MHSTRTTDRGGGDPSRDRALLPRHRPDGPRSRPQLLPRRRARRARIVLRHRRRVPRVGPAAAREVRRDNALHRQPTRRLRRRRHRVGRDLRDVGAPQHVGHAAPEPHAPGSASSTDSSVETANGGSRTESPSPTGRSGTVPTTGGRFPSTIASASAGAATRSTTGSGSPTKGPEPALYGLDIFLYRNMMRRWPEQRRRRTCSTRWPSRAGGRSSMLSSARSGP